MTTHPAFGCGRVRGDDGGLNSFMGSNGKAPYLIRVQGGTAGTGLTSSPG
jgi:hypothetical protein